MPNTLVHSRWKDGSLVFHDADDLGVGAEIFQISPSTIYIGTSTNDVTLTMYGAVSLYGDLSLADEDVSVEQGKYVYLDSQGGGEYIRSASANYIIVNGTTGVDLGIAGTAEVSLVANSLEPATTDECALGTGTVMWSDLFLASGGVINFNNGNMTITHSAGDLAVAGGTLTTAGIIVGTVATGISFTGTYTGNVIDFTSATIAPTGSAGPCFIRAGAYGSPVDLGADEDQSGMIRMYVTTSAGGSSYDRGLFMFCETTGTKGIMPLAGLAEVGAGGAPTAVYPLQAIAHLNSATASLGANAQMFGGWFKITANDGATIPSTARAAPLWLDNQLYGANAATIGEEYTIFSTTGGTVPKAWAGFETTGAGWDQLFYFDETMAAAEPFVSTGCNVTVASVPYLKVLVNATQYGIPLIAI